MKTPTISQAEMARHNAKLDQLDQAELDEERRDRASRRYTIADLHRLTGWTKVYFLRLEREKRIPRAKRVGSHRIHQWTEEQARQIIAFQHAQEQKFGKS